MGFRMAYRLLELAISPLSYDQKNGSSPFALSTRRKYSFIENMPNLANFCSISKLSNKNKLTSPAFCALPSAPVVQGTLRNCWWAPTNLGEPAQIEKWKGRINIRMSFIVRMGMASMFQ